MRATIPLAALFLAVACTATAQPWGEHSCADRAQDLRERLMSDGLILGLAHPDVALEVGTIDLPTADLPLYVQRIHGRRLGVSAGSEVSLARGKALPLYDLDLARVLAEPRGASEASFIELERWDPLVRETFDRHYELIDRGTAVFVDRSVPSADVVHLMTVLADLGWTEIDLLYLAESPPTVDAGLPHPDGDDALWFGHWPRWLSPPAALTEDLDHPPGRDVLALAPWRLRPLIFAELASEAYALASCPVPEDQVVWWQQLQFPPPRHAVARITLTQTDAVHRLITLDPDATWGDSAMAFAEALGDDLTATPGDRLAVWFASGDAFAVTEAVPTAWQAIPHYVPLDPTVAAEIADHPDAYQVSRGAPPVILGSMDPTHIEQVVDDHLDTLRSCFQYALRDGTTVRGEASVDLVLEPVGRVGRVSLSESTLAHGPTEQCILDTFAHMRFPGPLSSMVMVSQPIRYDGPRSAGDGPAPP